LAVFRIEPQAIQLLAFGWERLHVNTMGNITIVDRQLRSVMPPAM
jgi:hypothetical protein